MKRKEAAKFLAGFAANQALTHAAFAFTGVQFAMLGIQYTQGLNAVAAVVWAVALALLAYYGWVKR